MDCVDGCLQVKTSRAQRLKMSVFLQVIWILNSLPSTKQYHCLFTCVNVCSVYPFLAQSGVNCNWHFTVRVQCEDGVQPISTDFKTGGWQAIRASSFPCLLFPEELANILFTDLHRGGGVGRVMGCVKAVVIRFVWCGQSGWWGVKVFWSNLE